MELILLFFVLFPFVNSASPCRREFEETVCENFTFSHDLILDSATNKLKIKSAEGAVIHENFVKLEKVTEIEISGSDIARIEPGVLCCTPNLTTIIIGGNKKFPVITGRVLQACHDVKNVILDGAQIQIERGAFSTLKNLQRLTLNATSIRTLDKDVFKGLESLHSLTIRHSKVLKINETAFSELKNLKFIDLQSNQIEALPRNIFKGLIKLKFLNLSDNKLKNLTWREFDGLKSLRVLFLERNDFNSVDVDKLVAGVPDLERIFLSYDKLTPASRKKVEETLPKLNITFIYIGKPI